MTYPENSEASSQQSADQWTEELPSNNIKVETTKKTKTQTSLVLVQNIEETFTKTMTNSSTTARKKRGKINRLVAN